MRNIFVILLSFCIFQYTSGQSKPIAPQVDNTFKNQGHKPDTNYLSTPDYSIDHNWKIEFLKPPQLHSDDLLANIGRPNMETIIIYPTFHSNMPIHNPGFKFKMPTKIPDKSIDYKMKTLKIEVKPVQESNDIE